MRPIEIDHFTKYRSISRLRANRSGDVCFALKQPDLEQNRYSSNLWLYSNQKLAPLTFDGEASQFWWKNENSVIFSALRNPKDKEMAEKGFPLTVLYSLSLESPGEASEWLRLPYAVDDLALLPDGRIVFLAEYDPQQQKLLCGSESQEQKEQALKDADTVDVFTQLPFWRNGQGMNREKRSRLYLYDGQEVTPLTDEITDIESFHLSPEQDCVYCLGNSFEGMRPFPNLIYRVWFNGNPVQTASLEENFNHVGMVPLSGGKLFVGGSNSQEFGINQNPNFYCYDFENNSAVCLYGAGEYSAWNSLNTDVKLSSPVIWQACGKEVYWVSTLGGNSQLIKIHTETGEISKVTKEDGAVLEFVVGEDFLYFSAMRGLQGCELYTLGQQSQEREISSFNKSLVDEFVMCQPEPLSFTNGEGDEIQGWVIRPAGFIEGESYPAILSIHGGPKTAFGTLFIHEMQYLASQGFGVIFCNPTGSDGKGNEFADIRGRYGLVDYNDLMQFVDTALQNHRWIDSARLGVTGGSYGGYMTNWIIGHTSRFKAAVSQRGISNWVSMSLTTDIGYYFSPDQTGADIWTDHDAVWEQSPLKYANRVSTPTLFLHSDEDYRCWMVEAIQMYSALQLFGVETKICLFHGENHELSRSGKPKNRVRRLQEIIDWFTAYLC